MWKKYVRGKKFPKEMTEFLVLVEDYFDLDNHKIKIDMWQGEDWMIWGDRNIVRDKKRVIAWMPMPSKRLYFFTNEKWPKEVYEGESDD